MQYNKVWGEKKELWRKCARCSLRDARNVGLESPPRSLVSHKGAHNEWKESRVNLDSARGHKRHYTTVFTSLNILSCILAYWLSHAKVPLLLLLFSYFYTSVKTLITSRSHPDLSGYLLTRGAPVLWQRSLFNGGTTMWSEVSRNLQLTKVFHTKLPHLVQWLNLLLSLKMLGGNKTKHFALKINSG